MKLQKSIIGIGVLLLSLSSCDDFLDRMPDDKKNEVDVFLSLIHISEPTRPY